MACQRTLQQFDHVFITTVLIIEHVVCSYSRVCSVTGNSSAYQILNPITLCTYSLGESVLK